MNETQVPRPSLGIMASRSSMAQVHRESFIFGERVAWDLFKENHPRPNIRTMTIRNRAYSADLSRKA